MDSKLLRNHVIALLIFAILTCAATYPLIFMVNKGIPGSFSTDEPSVWYFWWIKFAHTNNLDHRHCQLLAHPFGQDYGIFDQLYPVWSFLKRITVLTSNPVFSYNIEIILSFVLSGFFMYLLMSFLTKDALIAVFSGIIYAFSPYHFAKAWQHIGLSHIEWFPLLLLALIKLGEYRNLRLSLFLILTIFAVFSFDLYNAYFGLMIIAIFIIFALFFARDGKSAIIKNIIINSFCGAFISLLVISPVLLKILGQSDGKSGAWNAAMRPFEDLFSQSAKALSYFLPAPYHPVFGRFTERLMGTILYGVSCTEHVLYLGWVPLIFAFVAFKRPLIKKTGFFLFLFFVSWLFSQPPWWNIGDFKIFMPSFAMYKILPMFRAYSRFGVLVVLAVSVLAGFGLKIFYEKFKSFRVRFAAVCIFSSLVLFEFWNYPPYKVIDLSRVPAVYYWLKAQPGDFVIAEYPLDLEGPSEAYKFHQTVHEKRIINATIPGTEANKASQAIKNLSASETTRTLKQMGVRYVLVHRQSYSDTGLIDDSEELDKITRNAGLKPVKSFPIQVCPDEGMMCVQKTGPIDVYEVAEEK